MNDSEKQPLNGSEHKPLKTNPKPVIITAMIGLMLSFGAFMVWASFAPLDEGVVAPGEVTVVSYKKAVQHQYGGTIQEILVKEGARVKKGQVLVRLNDAQPKANLANVRAEYYVALALEARLLAERRRADAIAFPKQIVPENHLPEVANHIKTQRELFNARRGALQNEFDILKENIEGMEEYIRRLDELQASRSKQMELLRSEMDSLKTMAEEGYYPRAKLLEMERMFAELSGKRSEDLGNIARTKKTVSEYKLTILRREHEFLKDVEAQLSEVQKNLGSLQDQYAASMDVLNKTEMKAPEDGTVVGLVVHTTGGVVMPGHTIMHLVPKDAGLIVDARVNTSDRDKVRIGLPVNLMFPAFNTRTTPVIEGEVTLISADRLQDEGSHTPYYLCRVKITEDGMRQLGDQHLEPGMPAQVVIKTGARTMMNYLVKPFFDRVSVSLKER